MKWIHLRSYIGLLTLFIVFVLFNAVTSRQLRKHRVDFTEEKLYTLSEGSVRMLGELKHSVELYYFFSKTDAAEIPNFKMYGDRVLDLLQNYAKHSDKVNLTVQDPRPDTEEALAAERYGLVAAEISPGESIYCGLVAIADTGRQETIAFFDMRKEESLEYDISKAISSVADLGARKLGIYSSFPLDGNPYGGPRGGEENEPWLFKQELQSLFDVTELRDLSNIPADLGTLLLVHPKNLSEAEEYAIDQFLLQGHSLVVLLDPFCEAEPITPDPSNPMAGMNRASVMPRVLVQNGIDMMAGKVLLDKELATSVQVGNGQSLEYYPWLNLTNKDVSQDDISTRKLESMILPTTGVLTLPENENLKVNILLESSRTANTADVNVVMFGGDPEKVKEAYQPGLGELPLAARVHGSFVTAFPEGKPVAADESDKPGDIPVLPFVSKSQKEASVVVIGNVDFLANRFCLRVIPMFNTFMLVNDNINFLLNALESLSGSQYLIDIRSRGTFTRPFTKVQEIEMRAEMKWKQEEQDLTQKLSDLSARINAFQQEGSDEKIASAAIISELENFKIEKQNVQLRLREVRKNLRKEKESLGLQLFLINTLMIPFIILCIGVFIWYSNLTSRKGKV